MYMHTVKAVSNQEGGQANLFLVLGAPWGQMYCLREGLGVGLSSCLWPRSKPYSDGLSPAYKNAQEKTHTHG